MSQDILQFLADRASNTPLTEAQFQSLRSELTTCLNALSVDVPGSTVTVLYSGHIGDNLHSGNPETGSETGSDTIYQRKQTIQRKRGQIR